VQLIGDTIGDIGKVQGLTTHLDGFADLGAVIQLKFPFRSVIKIPQNVSCPALHAVKILEQELKTVTLRVNDPECYQLPIEFTQRVRQKHSVKFYALATSSRCIDYGGLFRVGELLVKGFTLDDERIKAGRTLGQDYFDELLARIRDIRSSERLFYQKITDIYATSIDYDRDDELTQTFFKTVQNKMHWAAHGHTAAEVVRGRANASQPHMGLTTWKNAPQGPVRKTDVAVAKNYLNQEELQALNLIVSAYLDFAELQATGRRHMHMRDWLTKLDDYLRLSDRDVLTHAGKIRHSVAEQHAHTQFTKYEEMRLKIEAETASSDFDKAVEGVKKLSVPGSKRQEKQS
jgi:hypothetical protein